MIMEKVTIDEVGEKLKNRPNVLTSMMVTTIDEQSNIVNSIMNNFSITEEVDKETCTLTLHTELPVLEVGKRYRLSVMATKDPTPNDALGAVSLGYFRMRWNFQDATLISLNPAKFQGWRRLCFNEILLEMWDYD